MHLRIRILGNEVLLYGCIMILIDGTLLADLLSLMLYAPQIIMKGKGRRIKLPKAPCREKAILL